MVIVSIAMIVGVGTGDVMRLRVIVPQLFGPDQQAGQADAQQ